MYLFKIYIEHLLSLLMQNLDFETQNQYVRSDKLVLIFISLRMNLSDSALELT